MEIEKISVQVMPEDRVDDFLKADKEVWDPWLQQQRGYIRKVPTVYPGGRVDLRIYWASKRDWDRASKDPEIPAIEVRMRSQFLGLYRKLP